jgi:hypothetical protein
MHILTTASISGAVHAAMAALFVPILSMVFLGLGSGRTSEASIEKIIVVGLVAPLSWGVFGFAFGATLAWIHSLFTSEGAAKTSTVFVAEPVPVEEQAPYVAGTEAA